MIVDMEVCDICAQDGDNIQAVASYIGDENVEYHCCRKHLKGVKNLDLAYEMLDGFEEDDSEDEEE